MSRIVGLVPALALLLPACTGKLTDLPNQPGGNPLVPSVAAYPFPSDLYLADDPTTATGRRVAIPQEALPEGVSSETFATADGFPRIPAILTTFAAGIDPTSLPDYADEGATTQPDSPILLVREDTWERVPLLAELDTYTDRDDRRALILRPHHVLDPDAGYVVILRDGLRNASGGALTPTDAFRALRDGIKTDNDAVEAQRDDFELVHAALEALDLDPEEVVLAWPFHTRSEEQLVTPLLAMHDTMMSSVLGTWTPTSDAWESDGDNRLIEGTFTVPDFLGPEGIIELDSVGLPIVQGEREVEVLVTIPVTVTEPRPVILFGHGFFSSKEEPTWSSLNSGLQQWEMSAVTTDFIGFNEADQLDSFGLIAGDLDGLPQLVAQQLQSEAHFTALARLVSEQLADLVVEGVDTAAFKPLDGDAVHYMGISNGGTQGLMIMTASPALTRGALVVPGGAWSHMLQRAVQWNTMGFLLEEKFDNPLELQLITSLMQLVFDPVDAVNYAPHLVTDRFPGRPEVEITLHEAVADSQVSNLVTHWVARSAGIPLVTPSPIDIWGLETITAAPPGGAEVTSALLVYDELVAPCPVGNVPPTEDNGTHDTVRSLDAYKEQMGAFLEDGTIVQVCDGACDPD